MSRGAPPCGHMSVASLRVSCSSSCSRIVGWWGSGRWSATACTRRIRDARLRRRLRAAYLRPMLIARVVGRLVATIKQDTLSAVALQWIQPMTAAGAKTGKPLVAVDRIGVGPGELVYYITSREAGMTLENPF